MELIAAFEKGQPCPPTKASLKNEKIGQTRLAGLETVLVRGDNGQVPVGMYYYITTVAGELINTFEKRLVSNLRHHL